MEILKGEQVPIYTWASITSIESSAIDQLKVVAALPWVYDHIAVMPDVHAGKGATIGTVIASRDSLMPSAVGVDIACGMNAAKIADMQVRHLPDLHELREAIEAKVPVGFNSHQTPVVDEGAIAGFKDLTPGVQDRADNALYQIGTLGGGNHFIEISYDDENGNVWVLLHSGSRNIGKRIAEEHIAIAKAMPGNEKYGDLARLVLGSPEFKQYQNDLFWAQEYARINRFWIMELTLQAIEETTGFSKVEESVTCHHNFVERVVALVSGELFITRKGAINASLDRLGIIPGSMGTASFIVKGLGNKDSWNSASHGAGRKMSRGEAKRTFTQEDIDEQLKFVESKKDKTILDELPGAYKDVWKVMEQQSDLVTPVHTLFQLISIKG